MVYLMHLCGIACYAAAPDKTAPLLEAAAAGRHLSTLAFSEKGSRSHFWAPVSRATGSGNGAVQISAQKSFVTSAGHADGYVVSTLSAGATQPLESSIYLVLKEDAGVAVSGAETDRFDHCVFTVRQDLDPAVEQSWLDALFAMRYDNPAHREMMDLEGLKAWLPGRTTGFGPLTAAVETERFFAPASS